VFLILTLAGCGSDSNTDQTTTEAGAKNSKSKAAAKTGKGKSKVNKATKPGKGAKARPKTDRPDWDGDGPKTVVMIVMDTVRAQNTSVCGYERPNTPVLQKIVDDGGALSCRAYAAAPWTLPSHASYFTGVPTTVHGAQFVVDSEVSLNNRIKVRPLAATFDTLAEVYQKRGYQTVMLSANTIIKEESGLLQGFDVAYTGAQQGGSFRAELLAKKFGEVLKDDIDPEQPLFLFVNVFDAHDPYPAIPKGVDWAKKQDAVRLKPNQADKDNPLFAFMQGKMSDEEAAPFLEFVTNGYDYGISVADRNVGAILAQLKRADMLSDGYRLAITSDHGEFLGEHQLLRHGGFLYEPVTRVPFIYYDSTADKQPTLPDPFSATNIYQMLRDGRLPEGDDLVAPQANAEKDPDNIKVGAVSTAFWTGRDKLQWTEGDYELWDLASDPGETQSTPLGAHAGRDELEEQVELTKELEERPVGDNPELMDALRAIGYVADEE
jgi:hypothetical protein